MTAALCDQAHPYPDVEAAALELLERHGSALMATARRFAGSREDAEDAFQRGVEILLTKAPVRDGRLIPTDELVPWVRTVVKHEAWAIARRRWRAAPVVDDGEPPEPRSEPGLTADQAEHIDRLRLGAEALRELKPQEARALLLKAEGYTYKQIQERTGWTYTKVNRCLTEGRASLRRRVAAIEAGERCAELATAIEHVGELGERERGALRAHMRTCLACRARLRSLREHDAAAAHRARAA